MKKIKISEIRFDNLGVWPWSLILFICVLIFLGVILLGVWFDINGQLLKVNQTKEKQSTLLVEIKNRHQHASVLLQQQQYLKKLMHNVELLHERLPLRSEMPVLFEEISNYGKANNLDFKYFRPKTEKKKGVYSELPIEIAVEGDYHQIANFLSDISNLKRIITIPQLTLEYKRNSIRKGNLLLKVTIMMYYYSGSSYSLSESESSL